MPGNLKRNAVAVVLLAALLYWAFMFAKHDPSLRGIIPFGNDPYDSVGSFACIAGGLLAMLLLYRSFGPVQGAEFSAQQNVFLLRTQEAVVLTVIITVAADGIAMARHPRMWAGSPSRYELCGLLCGLLVAAAAVQLTLRASRKKLHSARRAAWMRAAIASCAAAFVLGCYPEEWINHTATHLITIAVGDVVLFAPMRPLLAALVPCGTDSNATKARDGRGKRAGIWRRWVIAILLGGIAGACAFAGEMIEGGLLPVGRLVFVGSIFVAAGIAGLAIGYAFLGAPLGLGDFRKWSFNHEDSEPVQKRKR